MSSPSLIFSFVVVAAAALSERDGGCVCADNAGDDYDGDGGDNGMIVSSKVAGVVGQLAAQHKVVWSSKGMA